MPRHPIRSVAVLTALSLERSAVVHHLTDSRERVHPQGTVYHVGTFPTTDGAITVAVAEIGAGTETASVHVERAATFLRPDLIAFVGVAGGIKDVVRGDVVIASKVYGYASGKADNKFLTRPEAYPLEHRLEQQVRQVITSAWAADLQAGEDGEQPAAVLGAVAAGDIVVTSTESPIYKFIRERYNDAIAVEMEGYGVLVGAHENDSLPAVIVRGISDRIDDKDQAGDAEWQPIAATNASAFLFALLERLASVVSPMQDGERDAIPEIAQHLSNAYYINVQRLLVDPTALDLLPHDEKQTLRSARSWNELGFGDTLTLLALCQRAVEHWRAPGNAVSRRFTE